MAFLMAKQDEPGGRFSDKDIALRIRQLGVGQNPQKTSKVIENVLSLANENANNNYNLLTGKNLPSFEEKEKKKKKEKSEDPLGLGF